MSQIKEEVNTFHMTPNTNIFINKIVDFESQSPYYPNAPRICRVTLSLSGLPVGPFHIVFYTGYSRVASLQILPGMEPTGLFCFIFVTSKYCAHSVRFRVS